MPMVMGERRCIHRINSIRYRELQQMLAERSVHIDHASRYRCVQRYALEIEKRLR